MAVGGYKFTLNKTVRQVNFPVVLPPSQTGQHKFPVQGEIERGRKKHVMTKNPSILLWYKTHWKWHQRVSPSYRHCITMFPLKKLHNSSFNSNIFFSSKWNDLPIFHCLHLEEVTWNLFIDIFRHPKFILLLAIVVFVLFPVHLALDSWHPQWDEDIRKYSKHWNFHHHVSLWNIYKWKFLGLVLKELPAKTLKLKDGKLCAYPVQNKWAARGPQCILRTLSIVHLRRLFTLILPSIWWAEPMLFVLFLC